MTLKRADNFFSIRTFVLGDLLDLLVAQPFPVAERPPRQHKSCELVFIEVDELPAEFELAGDRGVARTRLNVNPPELKHPYFYQPNQLLP